MARKKNPEKELKDQRIPIMMTSSELERIDHWSIGHGLRSRGEAIRRLCQIGITLDKNKENLDTAMLEGQAAIKKFLTKSRREELGEISKDAGEIVFNLMNAFNNLTETMLNIDKSAQAYKSDEDFENIEKRIASSEEFQQALFLEQFVRPILSQRDESERCLMLKRANDYLHVFKPNLRLSIANIAGEGERLIFLKTGPIDKTEIVESEANTPKTDSDYWKEFQKALPTSSEKKSKKEAGQN